VFTSGGLDLVLGSKILSVDSFSCCVSLLDENDRWEVVLVVRLRAASADFFRTNTALAEFYL
jgi:hypothetical protein